jgi:hypothetical protein
MPKPDEIASIRVGAGIEVCKNVPVPGFGEICQFPTM